MLGDRAILSVKILEPNPTVIANHMVATTRVEEA
jgi:hypothetical protein